MGEVQTAGQGNMREAKVPIATVISKAKEAQNSLGPISQDKDPGEWRQQTVPPAEFVIPPDLQELMSRLETHIDKKSPTAEAAQSSQQQENQDGQESPLSLEDIHFHTYNEGPNDGILKKSESPRAYYGSFEFKRALQARVDKLEGENTTTASTLKRWLSGIGGGNSGLSVNYQDNAEEYNGMEILLAKGGYGRREPSYSFDEHGPAIIAETMKIIRTPLENDYGGLQLRKDQKASWVGIGKNGYAFGADVYARAILERSQQIVGIDERIKTNTLYKFESNDFDLAVTATLACGDVKVALELIKLAPQFFPDQGEQAADNAFSRLQQTFRDARELTPSLASSIDEILICLGETGTYKEIGSSPIAQKLKKEAEERVKKSITEQRGDWYHAQEAVAVEKVSKGLSSEGLQSMVEEMAKNGKTWKEIEDQVIQRAVDVVDGNTANMLAAELVRRMYPDLSVQEQLERIRQVSAGIPNEETGFIVPSNMFDQLPRQDGKDFSDQTPFERAQSINNTYLPDERVLVNAIYHPNDFATARHLQTLVGLLKNPNAFPYTLNKGFSDMASNDRRYGYDYTKDPDPRIQLGRKVMAKRLIGGLSFLEACAEDPQIKALLDTQLGLKAWNDSILTPERIEKAQEALATMFADEVDKTSGLTMYESMLPDPDQKAEDSLTFKKINTAREAEITTLKGEKIPEAKDAVKTAIETRQAEKGQMDTHRVSLEQLTKKKSATETSIVRMEAVLKNIQRIETEENALKRIAKKTLSKTEVLTSLEKTARITSQQAKIQAARDELAALAGELQKVPGVSDQSYQFVTGLITSLGRVESSIK